MTRRYPDVSGYSLFATQSKAAIGNWQSAMESLTDNLTCVLVCAHAEQARVAQLSMHRPFDETNLDDNLWFDPMGPNTRQSNTLCKRRLGNFDLVELLAELE